MSERLVEATRTSEWCQKPACNLQEPPTVRLNSCKKASCGILSNHEVMEGLERGQSIVLLTLHTFMISRFPLLPRDLHGPPSS